MDALIGKVFGDFSIKKLIGKGNTSNVYLAEQISLRRNVALKILNLQVNDEDNRTVERFMREGRLAASIQHTNIIAVYSLGNHDAHHYIAMEYVPAPSLETLITNAPLSERATWLIGKQIVEALLAASEKNIIHRDIKPANILIYDGKVKVADFGLCKNPSVNCNITQNDVILGTPNYMSVEQAEGKKLDSRSDIYSLGGTIYRTLTGKLLFSANTVIDVLYKHKYENAIDPVELIPTISHNSSIIIGKMIRKHPEDRYQSYDDLLCDIKCFLQNQDLIYGTEKDSEKAYLEKLVHKNIFRKTSSFTKKMVANVENIVERQSQETKSIERTSRNSLNKDNKPLEATIYSPVTEKFKKFKNINKHLQTNIEYIEKKVGKLFSQYLLDHCVITIEELHKASNVFFHVNSTFGELAVSEGFLLPEQVKNVLKVQKRIKKTFGQLTMQMGLLNENQVQDILDKQHRHHIGFYEVLLRENFVDKTTLNKHLLDFTKLALD